MAEVYASTLGSLRIEEISTFLSLEEIVRVNSKVLRDLESMKSLHDCDLVVSASLLDHLRVKYSILTEFNLQVL